MHARNFTTNVPKILDLKSSSEQIFSRKLSLGAPDTRKKCCGNIVPCYVSERLNKIKERETARDRIPHTVNTVALPHTIDLVPRVSHFTAPCSERGER